MSASEGKEEKVHGEDSSEEEKKLKKKKVCEWMTGSPAGVKRHKRTEVKAPTVPELISLLALDLSVVEYLPHKQIPVIYYNKSAFSAPYAEAKWAKFSKEFSEELLAAWPPREFIYSTAGKVFSYKTEASHPYATSRPGDPVFYHVIYVDLQTGVPYHCRVDEKKTHNTSGEELQFATEGLAPLAGKLPIRALSAETAWERLGSLEPGDLTFTEMFQRFEPTTRPAYQPIEVWPTCGSSCLREALGRFILHHFFSGMSQPAQSKGFRPGKTRGYELQVVKIEVVYNEALNSRYRTTINEYKENYRVRKATPPVRLKSRYVWHGTDSAEVVSLIATYGWRGKFNSSSMYGLGSYFSVNASNSEGYAKRISAEHSQLILAQIITEGVVQGHTHMFHSGNSRPVWIKGTDRIRDFTADVATDALSSPFIYVCNRDESCLPLAIVTYKRITSKK